MTQCHYCNAWGYFLFWSLSISLSWFLGLPWAGIWAIPHRLIRRGIHGRLPNTFICPYVRKSSPPHSQALSLSTFSIGPSLKHEPTRRCILVDFHDQLLRFHSIAPKPGKFSSSEFCLKCISFCRLQCKRQACQDDVIRMIVLYHILYHGVWNKKKQKLTLPIGSWQSLQTFSKCDSRACFVMSYLPLGLHRYVTPSLS